MKTYFSLFLYYVYYKLCMVGANGCIYAIHTVISSFVEVSIIQQGYHLAYLLEYLLFYTSLIKKQKYIKIVVTISLCIVFGIILISGSRTGIVGIISVSILWLTKNLNLSKYQHNKIIILMLCFIILIFIFLLYFFHPESANGRVLIWINTWKMFLDNPLIGSGSGAFTAKYMLYQANYFITNPQSTFTQLADNVNHPFNEYLLILTEYGLIGILVFLFITLFLIYCYKRTKNETSFIFLMSIVSTASISCFSYPFRYPFTWIILLLGCIKLIQNANFIHSKKIFSPILAILFLISCIFLSFRIYPCLKAELKWTRIAQKALWEETEKVLYQYKELKAYLWNNPLFLYNYSVELNIAGKYEESLSVSRECEKKYNDYDLQLLIANNLMNLKRYNEAERSYTIASYMCPNRFAPLYSIFQILNLTDQKTRAQQLGEKILAKKIKIPSKTIEAIKKEIRINLKKSPMVNK